MSSIWRSARNFIYRRILHADDSPHRIALGVAIGVLIGLTPTMGLQTFVAIGVAALIGANKAVCVPVVWITNPVTFVPIYGACWWIGTLITGGATESPAAALQKLQAGGDGFFTSLFQYQFWADMTALMIDLGKELWVGCLVLGLVLAIPAYFITRRGIGSYRARRAARFLDRQAKRAERRRQRELKKAAHVAVDAA